METEANNPRNGYDDFAVVVGFSFIGTLLFGCLFVILIYFVTENVLPNVDSPERSYGQELIINFPAALLLGFVTGFSLGWYWMRGQQVAAVPNLVVSLVMLWMYYETWRHAGFGKDTSEYFSYVPNVILCALALVLAVAQGVMARAWR